jgi:outer membrane biosynthesis protein TonB
MSPDSFADVKEQYLQDMVTTPVTDPSTTLPPVNVTAGGEVGLSPTVTDTDVVNQIVAEQPSTTLDPVTIQGKREANVAPVVTGLDPVTVTAPTDASTPVVTTPPAAPEEKEEEPKKEKEPEEKPKEQPTNLYPTITTLPPPKRPGRQPIITGESPSRLLADALSAYRPSGAIEGGESGKERQNVWNEKSLRLKDALGL